MVMYKRKFVKAVAEKSGFTGKDIAKIMEAMQIIFKESMLREEDVTISGFGSFKVKERKARIGYNPHTKKKMKIAAKKVVKFSPSPNFEIDKLIKENLINQQKDKKGQKKTK